MQEFGKSWVAALYAVAVVAVPLWSGDHHIGPSEGVAILIAACAAALTFLVPLTTGTPWVKTAVTAVLAGAQVLATVILGGIDGNDVLLIVAAVAGAAGVWLAPAASHSAAVGWGSDAVV